MGIYAWVSIGEGKRGVGWIGDLEIRLVLISEHVLEGVARVVRLSEVGAWCWVDITRIEYTVRRLVEKMS